MTEIQQKNDWNDPKNDKRTEIPSKHKNDQNTPN